MTNTATMKPRREKKMTPQSQFSLDEVLFNQEEIARQLLHLKRYSDDIEKHLGIVSPVEVEPKKGKDIQDNFREKYNSKKNAIMSRLNEINESQKRIMQFLSVPDREQDDSPRACNTC